MEAVSYGLWNVSTREEAGKQFRLERECGGVRCSKSYGKTSLFAKNAQTCCRSCCDRI